MQKFVLKSSTISKSYSAKKVCFQPAPGSRCCRPTPPFIFSRFARNNLITPGVPLPIKSAPTGGPGATLARAEVQASAHRLERRHYTFPGCEAAKRKVEPRVEPALEKRQRLLRCTDSCPVPRRQALLCLPPTRAESLAYALSISFSSTLWNRLTSSARVGLARVPSDPSNTRGAWGQPPPRRATDTAGPAGVGTTTKPNDGGSGGNEHRRRSRAGVRSMRPSVPHGRRAGGLGVGYGSRHR